MMKSGKLYVDPLDEAPEGFTRTAPGWAVRKATPASKQVARLAGENKQLKNELTELRKLVETLKDKINGT